MNLIKRYVVPVTVIFLALLIGLFISESLMAVYKYQFNNQKFQKIINDRVGFPETYPISFPGDRIQSDPDFPSLGFDAIILSGIPNVRTIYCNESGNWFTYQSDKFGFNNTNKAYDSNEKVVVFIGDSFTHGACTKKGDGIVDIYSSNGYAALNFGMGGTGPLAQYAILNEFAASIKQRTSQVVWLFYEGNDLVVDMGNEVGYLQKYLEPSFSQEYVSRFNEIASAQREFIEGKMLARHFVSTELMRDVLTLKNIRGVINANFRQDKYGKGIAEWQRKNFELAKPAYDKTLVNVKNFAGQIPVKIIYLPADIRYCGERYRELTRLYVEQENWVKDRALSLGIKFESASLLINEINYSDLFYYNSCSNNGKGSHFNKLGNELIAKLIASQ
jgi:hypothetical protein